MNRTPKQTFQTDALPQLGLKGRIEAIIGPSSVLSNAVYYYGATILDILFVRRTPTLLFNIKELQDLAFTRFWLAKGDEYSQEMHPALPELLKDMQGTVLDLGPGNGSQLPRYTFTSVTAMYGAEPTVGLHHLLQKRAEELGVGSKYHILSCGAEPISLIPELAKKGLLEAGNEGQGIFDTIVSVRVLCGVPDIEETVDGLYRVLRPGGKLIFYEHIVSPWRSHVESIIPRFFQLIYTLLGWKFFMGGCNLDRDTLKSLLKAGQTKEGSGWKEINVTYQRPWAAIPYIRGYMVKK